MPLIGFSGAPFTLASYLVEGGGSSSHQKTKTLMYREPATWRLLMEKLAATVGAYLTAQVEAGAQALQLFDSWAGTLSPADYREHVLPLRPAGDRDRAQAGVPVINFSTGTGGMLETVRQAGGDVIGVDWRVDLDEAWRRLGDGVAVQGTFGLRTIFEQCQLHLILPFAGSARARSFSPCHAGELRLMGKGHVARSSAVSSLNRVLRSASKMRRKLPRAAGRTISPYQKP